MAQGWTLRRLPKAARTLRHALLRTAEALVAPPALLVLAPLYWLPPTAAIGLARFYGRVVWWCWPAGRRVAMINLRRALGVDRRQARALALRTFDELARSIAEGLQFARRHLRDPSSEWECTYRSEDRELEARLLADPRPKVFVTAHFGSWEMLAMLLARRFGRGGAALVRRLDNPLLDRALRRLRLLDASQWIEKRGGAAEALRRLRRGDSVALLLDENAGRQGIFVDFFGRPASTQRTAALLAHLAKAPVVVGALVRDVPGAPPLLRLHLIEPVRAGSPELDVHLLTQRIVAVHESWIRERPAQWRWMHWRWRERPDGTSERYGSADLRRAFATQPAGRPQAAPEASAAAEEV